MTQNRKNQSVATRVDTLIFMARGKRVLLDSDLAFIYGVSTKRLNEQVKRNKQRFPLDFCFQLKGKEINEIRSSASGRKMRPHPDATSVSVHMYSPNMALSWLPTY